MLNLGQAFCRSYSTNGFLQPIFCLLASVAISATFAISAISSQSPYPFATSKIVSKFPIFGTVSYLLFSTALTTPLNLGGCVTDYRCCRDSLNATLYINRRSILLADHCSHFSYHFMYIFHLIPIDLQSSRLFNPSHCKAYRLQSAFY